MPSSLQVFVREYLRGVDVPIARPLRSPLARGVLLWRPTTQTPKTQSRLACALAQIQRDKLGDPLLGFDCKLWDAYGDGVPEEVALPGVKIVHSRFSGQEAIDLGEGR